MTTFEMAPLDHHLPTRVVFGWGVSSRAAELASDFGHRALLVTMKELSQGARVAEVLRAAGIDLVVYDEAECDPSPERIDAAAPIVREGGFDFVVAVGGGSVMDTAKVLCLLAQADRSAWEHTIEFGDGRAMGGPLTLPLVAVPTTSGTGSEVTRVAVMSNRALKKKAPVRDPAIYPRLALVDPELAVTMPPKLTAATGFDAFTHAYERFFGGELSMLVHVLVTTGMRTVVENLATAVREPSNRAARTALSWAATQCAMALAPPGGEAALHVFGLTLGAVAGVSHGEALAAVTRVITRESLKRMPHRRSELAAIMGMPGESSDAEILDAIERWLGGVGLATTIPGALARPTGSPAPTCAGGEHGIGEDLLPELVAAISRPRLAGVFGPDFGEDDIRRLYLEAM